MNLEKMTREKLLSFSDCVDQPSTGIISLFYHFVPGHMRQWIAKILFRSHFKRAREELRTPRVYVDNGADQLVGELSQERSAKWSWPEGKKCALVLSHDIDTKGHQGPIQKLSQLALDRGMTSTFSCVGQNFKHYEKTLSHLREQGHDIALHDQIHDNLVCFKSPDEIVNRLSPSLPYIEKFKIKGFRSPSWYISLNLWEALRRMGFEYDMSALDTWSLFSKEKNFGTGTVYPFIYKNDLTVITNTIPFELPMYCHFKPTEYFDFWKPKLDAIANLGGVIMFNAHPDPWFSGNAPVINALERCLDYVLENHDPVCLNASQLNNHTRKSKENALMFSIGEDNEFIVPSLSKKPECAFHYIQKNPLLTDRKSFMMSL